MKHLLKFSFLIFGILILENCSVTENTEKYCPEDGCLLVRENPNDRFSEEDTKSEFEQEFEALEISNLESDELDIVNNSDKEENPQNSSWDSSPLVPEVDEIPF